MALTLTGIALASLAAARLRRAEEKAQTNVVNVVVQPGAK